MRNDEANASEDLPTFRQQRQQQRRSGQAAAASSSQDPAEERRQRDALVKSSLFRRTLEEGQSINSLQSVLSAAEERYRESDSEKENVLVRSWRSASSSVRNLAGRDKGDCSICLDHYAAGDSVCWAKTDDCDHVYHEECIAEWLRDHDDCPLCRAKLVGVGEAEEQGADAEGVEVELEEGL